MKVLVLLFVSPAIFAHGYQKDTDPNEEPFLPIFPVFPYNPKLMKRGAEREMVSQLTPELYAPKVDARDSYSANYNSNNNYQRDSYYPNYNPYPKSTSPSSYSSYYSMSPYTYSSSPYNYYQTPYPMTSPYSPAYSASSYPNYYYQPPYYYPGYYNQPFLPPLPPAGYSGASKDPADVESANEDKGRNSKDNSASDSGNGYVDGGNYISSGSKDLDSQPSTYKVPSSYNQLEQLTEMYLKNFPLSKGGYRLVAVSGQQPVNTDYAMPSSYVKAQQLEQIMSQTLAKLIAQNSQLAQNIQAAQNSQQNSQLIQYPAYEANQNNVGKSNDGYVNQNNPNGQSFVAMPNVIAKTGLAYVLNPQTLTKINLAQLNPAQIVQAGTTLGKTTKYPNPQFIQKPVTRVSLEESSGVYIPPGKSVKSQASGQPVEYDTYENQSAQDSQTYDGSLNQADDKQEQTAGNYHKKNYVTVQAPQTYTYQYSAYHAPETTSHQQSQHYKTNLEDVNYGAKINNDS